MSLTIFEGLQSEIFVPITPKPVWAPVTKELKDMKVALATAAGVHLKTDKRFNLAGDTTFREIPDTAHSSDLMVSHGGYDNADANKDINCMFPIGRLHELAKKGFIKSVAEFHYGFMGGGGDQEAFTNETGPAIAKKLKEEKTEEVQEKVANDYVLGKEEKKRIRKLERTREELLEKIESLEEKVSLVNNELTKEEVYTDAIKVQEYNEELRSLNQEREDLNNTGLEIEEELESLQ